jgi:hypothetical protein
MGYDNYRDWQTFEVHILMGNERKSYELKRKIVQQALAMGKSDDVTYQIVAKEFAKQFRKLRDQVKVEFDESLNDTITERGEFEARQIEGKKPTPSEFGHNGDVLNEVMDMIRSDMGSGLLPRWEEPDWLELAECEVEQEKLERSSAKAVMQMKQQPGEDVELPPDMTEGLKAMGIRGSKETVMTKVAFVLKGHKFVSSLPSAKAAGRFIKAANDKWGKEFKVGGMGTDQESELVTSGVNVLDAAVVPEHLEDTKFAAGGGDTFQGAYIVMQQDAYKHLQVRATPQGRREAETLAGEPTDNALASLLEDATGNGWEWKTPEELGALTSAPILASPAGNVYWHERYQVDDPIEMLAKGGMVQFNYAGNLNETEEVPVEGKAPEAAIGGGIMASAKAKIGKKMKSFDFFFPRQVLREFYPKIRLGAFNFSPAHVQGQVAREFTDEIPGNTVDKVNPNIGGYEDNHPMLNPEISGDMHTIAALEDLFDNLTKLSYVSTSPAGAAGLGRDFKPQTLEGQAFRSPDDARGGMFGEEFYQNYGMGPDGDALSHLAAMMDEDKHETCGKCGQCIHCGTCHCPEPQRTGKFGENKEAHRKLAGMGNAKEQFGTFLKMVMMEIATTLLSAWKVTNRPPLNKIPGTGEVQLDQIEQQQYQGISSLSLTVTKSQVKYLVEKLNDGDLQEVLNDSWAQAAAWCGSPNGGGVREVFVRAETLDSESLRLVYKFVTGTRDSAA